MVGYSSEEYVGHHLACDPALLPPLGVYANIIVVKEVLKEYLPAAIVFAFLKSVV